MFRRLTLIPPQDVDFLLSIFEIDVILRTEIEKEFKIWHFERFDHCRSSVTYQDNYVDTPRFDRLIHNGR